MNHYQLNLIKSSKVTSSDKYSNFYPVQISPNSYLQLPLRPLPDGHRAIALLMTLQSPFAVIDHINKLLAKLIKSFNPEIIVGLPTLGFTLAEGVARLLGHPNYVALTNSQKFWQDQALSIPVNSITSANGKMLYLDQYLIPRIANKRTVIIDDVISTGGSMASAINLIKKINPSALYAATVLSEGIIWQSVLDSIGFEWQNKIKSLGHVPMFQKSDEGNWIPITP